MFNDTYYTNKYIAQVGGCTLQNINELEAFFMKMIDWNIYVSEHELEFYEQGLTRFQASPQMSPLQSGHNSPILSPILQSQQQPEELHPVSQIQVKLQQQRQLQQIHAA